MKIGIHQPNFMPWVGFFKKIENSDTFIILDKVKGSKNSFFNRNIFTSNNGKSTFWLSIPISKKEYKKNISEIESIDNRWIEKHLKYLKIEHGKTTEKDFLGEIESIYLEFKK